MSIIVGGAAAPAPGAAPFHAFDEVGSAGGPFVLNPDGSMGATSPVFWADILGGGHGWAGPGAAGPMQGIRARQSNGAGVGARTNLLDWRLGQRYSLSPLITSQVVRQRKWTFQCAVAANGNGAEIGVKQDPNTFATANTILGYGLQVAAGNWAGIRRLVTGAATQAVAVLQSLSAVVPRRFKATFTEGTTPVLEFFLDNQLIFSVSGEANMPELSVGFGITYAPAVTSVAGVVISTTAAELTLEYL